MSVTVRGPACVQTPSGGFPARMWPISFFKHLTNGRQVRQCLAVVISSSRVGRKRGFTNARAYCDIHQRHSVDSSCCALVCLRHLDEFHGGCEHSRRLASQDPSGLAVCQFCHHFSSCIPVL